MILLRSNTIASSMDTIRNKLTLYSARLAWSGLNLAGAHFTALAAGTQVLVFLVKGKWYAAWRTAVNGVYGYWYDLKIVGQLTVGILHPIAPETVGVSEKHWCVIANAQQAVCALQAWSLHQWPTDNSAYTPQDVTIFLQAARVMMIASALAYADEGTAQEQLDKCCGDEMTWRVRVLDHDNAQVMVYFLNWCECPVAIVAFRGTELPDDDATREFFPDWFRNLNFTLAPYHDVEQQTDENVPMAACGFLKSWKGLQPMVFKEFQEFSDKVGRKQLQVYITGHSQGGALASLSLLDFLTKQSDLYCIKGCLTIAQPKIGNCELSRAIEAAVALTANPANNSTAIPLDMVGNEDVTGFDPVVSVAPGLGVPAGRFWKVRVGEKTMGPMTCEQHEQVVNAPITSIIRRGIFSTTLHFPGGRIGYLSAMEE